ncbi:hypothetical protein ACJ73_09353, partial [Blastomyces percursus]
MPLSKYPRHRTQGTKPLKIVTPASLCESPSFPRIPAYRPTGPGIRNVSGLDWAKSSFVVVRLRQPCSSVPLALVESAGVPAHRRSWRRRSSPNPARLPSEMEAQASLKGAAV